MERRVGLGGTLKLILGDLRFYSKTGSWLDKLATVFFSLAFQTLALYRMAKWCKKSRFFRLFAVPLLYYQQILSGCQIHPMAEIGKDFDLPHPTGIIIGAQVRIGSHVTIYQNVTLGSHGQAAQAKKYPVVEDDVTIYAGTVVAGGAVIGKGAVIGANAVVLSDIPAGCTAVGIPAKPLQR